MKIVPVILAGGIGERFWPASRSSKPKQLLPLLSDKMMIEETFERVLPLCTEGVKPLIVTGAKIASLIDDALQSDYDYDIIAEPVGKNTAPAVGAAAVFCKVAYGEDAVMAVVSADHSIRPVEKFIAAATYGAQIAAEKDTLVVYGIKPDRPETGYGYIELEGQDGTSDNGIASFKVKQFVEKPDGATAQTYLDAGNYLWNSGMFIWRTSVILNQFKNHMVSLYSDLEILEGNDCSKEAIFEFYTNCIKESIDFGIMENADSVHAVEGVFDWDDIGAWESLERIHGKDASGNCSSGNKNYVAESTNTIVANQSNHTVAVIGADNLVVVTVDDATMVISRDKLPEIKKHIAALKEGNFPAELF